MAGPPSGLAPTETQLMRKTLPRLSVFVMGGTGFIGKHLTARLVRAGHDVTVLTRSRANHRDMLVLPTLRLIEGDPYDVDTVTQVLSGCDAVINLIGIGNESRRGNNSFQRAHVELTQQLVTACGNAGTRRLVQLSALKADPGGASGFLRTKGKADEIVRQSGLDWTILQPSVVFGPQDKLINRLASLLIRLPVIPLPRANARLAPVFVGDVAEATLRVVRGRSSIGKTYELCGPRVFSLREIVQLATQASGRRRLIVPLSSSSSRLMSRLLELVPGKPFSLDNYLTLSVHSICSSGAPGLRDLGIEPNAFEPSVQSQLRRMRKHHSVPDSGN